MRVFSLAAFLVCLACAAGAAEPGWLSVHASGRWLVNEQGRPVFLLGDTGWSLARRLKREDAAGYLQHRRKQGFNAIALVAINPAEKTNAYGAAPFEVKNGRMDPAQPLIQGKDNYWTHLDYILSEMRRLGLYAILLPTWGSAVAGDYNGKPNADVIFDASNAYVYGRWIGARYGRHPHIIWMLGGDRSAVSGEMDYRPIFRAMAKGVKEGAGAPLLMSYHPRKSNPQSSAWFHEDSWLDFNSIQEWPEAQAAAVAHDWNLSPPKPTWLFEGRYEGYWKNKYKPEQWGEWQMRYQAYQTVLGGAFGHTYGHERIFSFGADDWDWKSALDSPGARSMTHFAKLMNSISDAHLLTRMPDQTLVDGDEGKAERLTSTRISAMRTSDGRLAMLYSANGRSMRVRMDKLGRGGMNAWWFNPRTGMWHNGSAEIREQRKFAAKVPSGPGAPVKEFDPPGEEGEGSDWMLILCTGEQL